MPSQALAAYGTLLKRGSSPSGTNQNDASYVTIGEVKSIKGPSTEVSVLDVTTHSSAASGNYREKIPSLIDPGEIEFEINYVPTNSTIQNLRADLVGRTKRDFKLQTPADSTGASSNMLFAGYVTSFPLEFPTDDVMSSNIKITLTGAITFQP